MTDEAQRIQDALRAMAYADRELVRVPPFTAAIDPVDPMPFMSYAVPDAGASRWPAEAIDELCDAFRTRRRAPRLEVVEACWPGLEPALTARGFEVELRSLGMACAPADTAEAPLPGGARIEAVGPDASDASIAAVLATRGAAFADLGALEPPDAEHVERFRRRGIGTVLARSAGGELLGVASWVLPALGVSEIVAVGVPEAHRRRGIAAAVTAAAARAAFAAGADLAFLTPGHDAAARVYARAGFRPSVRCLHLISR